MRLIRWSVNNPGPVFAFYAGLLLLAAFSLWRLIPLRLTPAVSSSQLAVITEAMGMPPALVERHLTDPLERAVARVPNVVAVRSSSMEGMSIVILEFPYDYDLRAGNEDTRAALATVELAMDEGASYGHGATVPRVVPYDPLRIPVLRLAVRAPDWDASTLSRFLELELTSRLKRVAGVETVSIFGLPRQQVSVLVDRGAAAAAGLSLSQVREALDKANTARSAGALHDALSRVTPVTLDAQARTTQELEGLVVAARPDEPPLTLKDIASVDLHLDTNRSLYRYNGKEAVEIVVVESAGASSPRTVAALRAVVKEEMGRHPGLQVEEAYNNAHFVSIVAGNVWWELGLAVVLTGLVAFVFLGEWRATLVVLVTVPVTLAGAVLFFAPLGLSFNSSTLIGLLLAIGRLVDDTIIDLCAVAHHRAMGKDARTAAIDGCSSVRRAVVSATLVICLVMLPLTFTGGLTQDMFEGIVWPFLLALAASLGVALTLAPALIARLYQNQPAQTGSGRFASHLERVESAYRRLLIGALRNRGTVLFGALATLYLALVMYPRVGWEMMPQADTGQIYAVLEARPGTPASETARLAAKLEEILLRQPEVRKVSTEIGAGEPAALWTGYGNTGPSYANMLITLWDKGDRERSLWQIVDAVYLQASLTVPHLRRLTLREMGSDVMATAMAPVQLVIRGPELERLALLAEQTRDLGRQSRQLVRPGGLTQVGTSWSLEDGGWSLRPRPGAVAGLGVSPESMALQADLALAGAATRTSMADGTPIMVSYPAQQRRTYSDLEWVLIQGSHGSRTLAELADIEASTTATMIEHDNLQRSNSVTASYRQGGAGSMQLGMDWLMASRMHVGFPSGYSVELRGDMVAMMDSSRRLLWGMGVALALMYLALAAQFRSAILPLVIMAAIPVSLPGVLAALLMAGQTVSTVSLLGLAVSIGMDVTASILLLDAVSMERARGRSVWRALLVGAPNRLRPVLMTVAITLAVMAPLACFPSTGMDAYAPLATVVMGGLAMSCALTLLLVPVLYSFAANLRSR